MQAFYLCSCSYIISYAFKGDMIKLLKSLKPSHVQYGSDREVLTSQAFSAKQASLVKLKSTDTSLIGRFVYILL